MQVIPAVLIHSVDEFKQQLKQLSSHFNHFSIDIEDGTFTSTTTISLDEVIAVLSASENNYSSLTFDFDLMVLDYKTALEKISKLNAANIAVQRNFIHLGALKRNVKSASELCIALDPEDKVETIVSEIDMSNIPAIQIMTIHSGPQGQAFVPDSLNKIQQLRTAGYRNEIFLDGSINETTIPLILEKEFKPDFLCIGSYLSRAGDQLETRIGKLNSLLGHQ